MTTLITIYNRLVSHRMISHKSLYAVKKLFILNNDLESGKVKITSKNKFNDWTNKQKRDLRFLLDSLDENDFPDEQYYYYFMLMNKSHFLYL
jgi:hypothetical protein